MKETKYGIISDVHQNPKVVVPAIMALKCEGIEKLVLNGDIGNSQQFVGFILDSAGKSGIETYVQPGSHEELVDFQPVMDHFASKYPNLINAVENQKATNDGHDLVFLPGTDWSCGGQYIITSSDLESGIYKDEDENYNYLSSMSDLKKLVTNPEKTIVFCHVPRKFYNLENGVDIAEFGEALANFNLNGNLVEAGSVFPLPVAKKIIEAGAPVRIKKENRGNADLMDLYDEIGISKAVSGHFHESGHKACNSCGNHIEQGEFVKDLFWNSGYCDAGQAGILSVRDEQVAYKNITFNVNS